MLRTLYTGGKKNIRKNYIKISRLLLLEMIGAFFLWLEDFYNDPCVNQTCEYDDTPYL